MKGFLLLRNAFAHAARKIEKKKKKNDEYDYVSLSLSLLFSLINHPRSSFPKQFRRHSHTTITDSPNNKTEEVLEFTRSFSTTDVDTFATTTGDMNPIHLVSGERNDSSNNSGIISSSRIVHGALVASMFPAVIGTTFPGSKYLSQTLKFREEVKIGEKVTAVVTRKRETRGGRIVEFETVARCANDSRRIFIDGVALAQIPINKKI